MPIPLQSNDTKRNLFIGGGFLLFGAVGFAIGYSASIVEAPIAPAKVITSSTGPESVNVGGDNRVGGIFAADATSKGGTPPTVGEITGGQPLEDWLKRVMAQEDELFRMQNFMKLLESLNTPADIEAALKVIMENGGRGSRGPGGGRFTELSMLMAKYVQLDPKAAMTYSSKLEGGEKFMATSSALRTWTRLSPEDALAWAKTEGANITMDFGRGGPGGGGDQAEGAPKDNFALLSVVSQLAKTDLDKALTTASTMELGRFGDRMVDTLAREMVSQRGVDASKAYLDSLPAGAFRDQYLQQLADPLAKKDPAGTAKWLAGMPSSETSDAKRRALGNTVDSWAKTNFAAASTYVNSQPVGADWDSARNEIINANPDPKAAWNQISGISDPERQARAAMQVGPKLVKADPTNGPAIIASSNLPDEVKARASQPQQDRGQGRGGFNGVGGGRPPGR